MGGLGDLSVSGLWRVDSGRRYSLAAQKPAASTCHPEGDPRGGRLSGSPARPAARVLWRRARLRNASPATGCSTRRSTTTSRCSESLRPWVKFDVYNLFDNQKLIAWNTTVSQNAASPKDSLGLATSYIQGRDIRQGDGQHGRPTCNYDRHQRVPGGVQRRAGRRPHVPRGGGLPVLRRSG